MENMGISGINGYSGLFDFAVPTVSIVDPEKEKNVGKKKGKTEKKPPVMNKGPKMYKMPIMCFSDYVQPFSIGEEGMEMSLDDIVNEAKKRYSFLENFDVELMSDERFIFIPSNTNIIKKGTINVGDELSIYIGDTPIDISEVTKDESTIEVSKVVEFIEKQSGSKVALIKKDENTYWAVFVMKDSASADKLKFPFELMQGMNKTFTVTEEIFRAALSSEDSTEESKLLTDNNLLSYVVTQDENYKGGHVHIYINEKLNVVRTFYKKKWDAGVPKKPEKELYPTNALLTAHSERYQLSSDLFGGEEEVDGKRIITYLGKHLPEFRKDNTKFLYYKDTNILVAYIETSKRGTISYVVENGCEYRISDTPYAYIKIATDRSGNGSVQLKFPKIPVSIFRSMYAFMEAVFNKYKTECHCEIMWNNLKKEYFVYVPEQLVSASAVEITYDPEIYANLDIYRIGTFHSHGYFGAFFSDEDDKYETGEGFYGVIGNLASEEPDVVVRAGTGGYYKTISLYDLFDKNVEKESVDLTTEVYMKNVQPNLGRVHSFGY